MEENKTTTKSLKPEIFILTKEVRKVLGIKLQPYVRSRPKISRNAPCPCGSGLKYKQCCLELDKLESNETNREDL